ncbi:23S rRNA (adenine(2503)-C(2))-methyltransferase RlmN [Phytoactinopolyspora halotolerans]|uniref:Probable dual-specificity RNA methyltransferase RlmN n=1 Tax=Phytoactinopolyspora halotolerans TaxID=1981512 RepID=A0A6L9SGE0_9ACTN|nr:23S rRNA (adenine(2503)-C(2))-methyltransferase RlmN [Phytoactinopolyspora halotolerans]NEE03688.1 23S rRNA (adenine(2503)-C(2))-methyltransferase RlmN [Phytoactinopolyspora halotolerans]
MPENVSLARPDEPTAPQPGELQLTPARRGKPPRHLADLDVDARRAAVAGLGEKPFRADQLSRHYFARFVSDAAQMTDIPAGVRDDIGGAMLPSLVTPVKNVETDGGATRKTLWRLHDGAMVESVLMRYGDAVRGVARSDAAEQAGHGQAGHGQTGRGQAGYGQAVQDVAGNRRGPGRGRGGASSARTPARDRVTICVSSQAGCGMNCPFCATGQQGLTRNMSAAEIVEQVVAGARALAAGEIAGGPGRVTNVVFMGMGEPMANYKAVVTAIRRMTDPVPAGLGISQRGVTVSTVGLVSAIDRLASEQLSVTLALSLHAPDDELRDELVPINTRWKVGEALDAARRYFDRTGRRVSIEYALIRDINDQEWRADLLGRLLAERGRGWVHVNPIPLNPTPGSKWTASDPEVERAFVAALERHDIPVTVRDTRGRDIDGACGQLATSSA